MKLLVTATAALFVVAVAAPLSAQCTPANSLATPLSNNGQSGYMFDLEPTGGAPLLIQSFDVITTAAAVPAAYEVWVRSPLESYTGFNTSNAGWTLLGTSAPVASVTTNVPVPLNLCLGYTLQVGGRTGFYVTATTGTATRYTNGTLVGDPWASDANLTVYQGHGGAVFNLTFSPRNFAGNILYEPATNILSMSQSGPLVGDLTVSLDNVSAGAVEGWTLLSAVTAFPAGSGPFVGVFPDSNTFFVLALPAVDGNPFHYPVPSPSGSYPNSPFVVGPGAVNGLAGLTFDFVTFLTGSGGSFAGRSNVVRFTFQ
jgi:hypothetical protein